jgi:signal transduction histidine kinase
LARDLHDTVAHHVSAIAVRAQAGIATAASNPDAADEALRVIESEARLTLGEMRSMVRVLRDTEAGERSPAPGAAELEQLGAPNDGVPVSVHITGNVDGVPAPIATAAYRVAQEAVTNARKHAVGATGIDASVTVDAAEVVVRVHDDGQPVARRTGAAPGFGLVGMAERAALLGGTCSAGADPTGGWTVLVGLPLDSPPDDGAGAA